MNNEQEKDNMDIPGMLPEAEQTTRQPKNMSG